MLAIFSLCKLFGFYLSSASMTGGNFRFQIPSLALIIYIFLSPNHAIDLEGSGIEWINPPTCSPEHSNWMVGEQQNLSWHASCCEDLNNISLVQELPGGDESMRYYNRSAGVVVYSITYLFYTPLIFNYVKLHATLKGANNMTIFENRRSLA